MNVTPCPAPWQSSFLPMIPTIERHARRALRKLDPEDRQEATQAVLASTAVAYARLASRGSEHRAYATPLARYGVRQYRAGRLTGGSVNAHDVGSVRCRLRGCRVEALDPWSEYLSETRHATPAEAAALRLDFRQWFASLSCRDQRIVAALAQGERTSQVAKLCQLTAGRVSQLRRELCDSWRLFLGEVGTTA
jgi:transposase-like protein